MFRRKLQEKLEKFAALLKECLDAQRETGKRLDGLGERLRRLEAGEKKLAKAIENKPDSKKVDADLDKRLGAFHKRICELEVSRAGFDQANVEARTAVAALNALHARLQRGTLALQARFFGPMPAQLLIEGAFFVQEDLVFLVADVNVEAFDAAAVLVVTLGLAHLPAERAGLSLNFCYDIV